MTVRERVAVWMLGVATIALMVSYAFAMASSIQEINELERQNQDLQIQSQDNEEQWIIQAVSEQEFNHLKRLQERIRPLLPQDELNYEYRKEYHTATVQSGRAKAVVANRNQSSLCGVGELQSSTGGQSSRLCHFGAIERDARK